MKAAQISQHGGPEVIEINEVPQPQPASGQVLVEVRAAALNPFDYKLRSGPMDINFPFTLGGDFAGVVKEAAANVKDFKVSDGVYGWALAMGAGTGALAEMAAVNTDAIALKPNNINFEEAASLGLVGKSAIQALDQLNLAAGQKILIHGGAGGIGSTAIQYAKHLGANVATTARAEDFDFVKSLGASDAIDYQKQNFEEILKDYDAVFDTVGGETYKNSFKILKKGGAAVSMLERPDEKLANSYGVKALYQATKHDRPTLEKLKDLVEQGAIKPQVDKAFPLEQTAEAFKYLETGHPHGKVVIQINS